MSAQKWVEERGRERGEPADHGRLPPIGRAQHSYEAVQGLRTSPAAQSERARQDMLSLPREPFWLCQWREVVFLHLETDPETLQDIIPFHLDLFEGRAFVSLVAFTLRDMRPRRGGRLARWLFKPFGTHRFLNVRTYVKHGDQRGIYFLAEFLDAPRLNHLAGPALYGLPFSIGKLDYKNRFSTDGLKGTVVARGRTLKYEGNKRNESTSRKEGWHQRPAFSEFLLERYRAFTACRGRKGWFPVWHHPWRYECVDAALIDRSLLGPTGRWSGNAPLIAAHHSGGLNEVWMGLRQSL